MSEYEALNLMYLVLHLMPSIHSALFYLLG